MLKVRTLLRRLKSVFFAPQVSVIIPCRNAEDYLEKAIRSVLNQDFRDVEVIVVDDCSTDSSAQIVSRLASRDARVRLLKGRGQGPGAARNDGIHRARGTYLTFVDADDLVLPGAYSLMVKAFESPIDFVSGGYRRHGPGASHRPQLVQRVHACRVENATLESFPLVLDEPVVWNKMFRRDFWLREDISFPEDVNYEDQLPCLTAAMRARAFTVLAEDVYSWRLPEGRKSRSQGKADIGDLQDRIAVITTMMDHLKGLNPVIEHYARVLWLQRDIPMYAVHIGRVSDEYVEKLSGLVRCILDRADHTVWERLPFWERLLVWALADGDITQIEEIVASRVEDTPAAPFEWSVDEGGRIVAPVLSRLTRVPEYIRRFYAIDCSARAALTGMRWTDAGILELEGYAFIQGSPSCATDTLKVIVVNEYDQTIDDSVRVERHHDPLIDCRVNDPWRSYANAAFTAFVDLSVMNTCAGQNARLRIILGQGTYTSTVLVDYPEGFRPTLASPKDAEGKACVVYRGQNDWLSIREIPSCSWRLVDWARNDRTLSLRLHNCGGGTLDHLWIKSGKEIIQAEVFYQDEQWLAQLDFPDLSEHGQRKHCSWHLRVNSGEDVSWGLGASLALSEVDVHPGLTPTGSVYFDQRRCRVLVDEVVVEDACLRVKGRAGDASEVKFLFLTSSQASVASPCVACDTNQWEAHFDLADIVLPSGGFFLRWSESAMTPPSDQHWCEAGWLPAGETYFVGTVRSARVNTHANSSVSVTIGASLTDDERSRYGKQQIIESAVDERIDGIVFESFSGKSTSDNPGALCEQLQAAGINVPMWWSVIDGTVPVPQGTTPLVIGTREWARVVRSATLLITNNNFPAWFRKTPGQFWIQTWHGTPIKRLLFDAPREFIPLTYRRLMARQVADWDLLLAQTESAAQDLVGSTGYTGEVLVIEQPRNVRLLGGAERAEQVRRELAIGEGERVILYAPTWREGLREGSTVEGGGLLSPTQLAADTGVTVLVRSHHMNNLGASGPGVRDVGDYPHVEDLMLAADILISDYSSIFFDFALTGRPAVVYAPDLAWYRDVERGFYGQWPRAPWPHATRYDELLDLLRPIVAAEPHELAVDRLHLEQSRDCLLARIVSILEK